MQREINWKLLKSICANGAMGQAPLKETADSCERSTSTCASISTLLYRTELGVELQHKFGLELRNSNAECRCSLAMASQLGSLPRFRCIFVDCFIAFGTQAGLLTRVASCNFRWSETLQMSLWLLRRD